MYHQKLITMKKFTILASDWIILCELRDMFISGDKGSVLDGSLLWAVFMEWAETKTHHFTYPIEKRVKMPTSLLMTLQSLLIHYGDETLNSVHISYPQLQDFRARVDKCYVDRLHEWMYAGKVEQRDLQYDTLYGEARRALPHAEDAAPLGLQSINH
jgi:hypothetical protein